MAFERNLVRLAPNESAYEGAPDDGRYNSMLSCLVYIARLQGLFLSEQQLVLDNQLAADRVAPQELAFIAQRAGMRARAIRPSIDDLISLRRACPAIVTLRSGGAMVVTMIGRSEDGITFLELVDPDAGPEAAVRLDIGRFQEGWTGDLLLLKREFNIRDENQPFGIRFIAGQLLREGKLVRDIIVCALFMSALALVPLFYLRLMISDTLYYNAINTFWLLVFLLVWAFTFIGTFSFIRHYLISVVTVRVDARLNEYVYDRLLTLPIDYFERTPVGEISHKVNELVKIREFIGRAMFGTVLDATVLLFFMPVMFYFSWVMTMIVLAAVLSMMGVIVMTLPSLRAASGRLIQARVRRGTALYQTLAGIRTVKSLALEARQRANWDVLTADVARKDFETQRISNWLMTAVYPLEQMAMYGSFTVGGYLVLTGSDPMLLPYLLIYVMFSHKVISPFIQLAQLIEQYDEVRITIEIISEVVNRPPEDSAGDHGIRKPLQGHVEFSGLRFKYAGSQNYALDGVSFEIPVGTTIGLVGRSGSGKTTVTRLLQRLHSEYDGLIKVDGVDVREYDLAHLRRSLGVVLQENFLFSGTIRENVVAAKPSASFDEVVNACRLAGAEEFIERLPRGFDTYIYEGSPNLSGGQRQRLAIARALIVDPRILILDEATSALDPDSEAIVNDNIRRIAEGRTMLVVSHRLSSLVNSDAILVLERGKVVDLAPHAVLLERCEIYRNLWNQQNRHSMAAARQTVRGPSRVS